MGFHIEDYCLNFLDCCQRCLGCRTDKGKMYVEHTGRLIRAREEYRYGRTDFTCIFLSPQVKALPIGIPYARFEKLALKAPRVFPNDMKVRRRIMFFNTLLNLFSQAA